MSERAPHEDDRSLLDQTLYLASRIYDDPNTPAIPIDLHSACAIGRDDIVEDAIAAGTDFNARNKAGWTPLMYASHCGHDTVVYLLLEAGAEPSRGTPSGLTPLMVAAGCGNESVCYFLLQARAEIDSQDSNGYTALVHGVRQGQQTVVQLLLEAGADMELADKEHGYTALMQASIEGDEIIVDVLVACDANLNAKDKCGETARSLAYKHHQVRTATLLDNAIFMDSETQPAEGPESTCSDEDLFFGTKALKTQRRVIQKMEKIRSHSYIGADSKHKKPPVLLRSASLPEISHEIDTSDSEEDVLTSDLEESGVDQEVVDFLTELSLEKYIEVFTEQEIDFQSFLNFNEEDLKRLGIKLYGPRRKIFQAIQDFSAIMPKSGATFKDASLLLPRRNIPSDSGYQSFSASRDAHLSKTSHHNRRILKLNQRRMQEAASNLKAQKQPLKQTEFVLPGVEVAGRVTVEMTNSAQSLSWDGLNLHIPQDSLPAGLTHCTLDIMSTTSGHYLPPDDFELLSPVYWVRPTPHCQFQKPLALEIQHCARNPSSVELTFLRAICSQETLPYVFKEVKRKGSFSVNSSYGLLRVYNFSGYAVGGKSSSGEEVEKFYFASFYHSQINHWTTEIFFVIALDHQLYRKKVKNHFQELGAEHRSTLDIEFEGDRIGLDIPIGGVKVSEWTIIPQSSPLEISRRRVEFACTQNTDLPCRQLTATLPPGYPKSLPACSHPITLQGAKFPEQLNIVLGVFMPSNIKQELGQSVLESKSALALTRPINHPLSHQIPQSISPGFALAPHTVFSANYYPEQPSSYHLPWLGSIGATPGAYHPARNDLSQYGLAVPSMAKAIEDSTASLDQLVDHVGISRELLDNEISDHHLRELAILLPSWQACAPYLGLTDHEVQDLHDKSWADNTLKTIELLKKWHKRLAFQARYSILVELCLNFRQGTSATKICQLLKSEVTVITTVKSFSRLSV